jgi:hypothetical protein
MNTFVGRFVYSIFLRLHPASFRDEFGVEMRWIFEEESKCGRVAPLFFDGAISLLRQRFRVRRDPGQLSITSGAIITGPGIGLVRLLQGGIAFSAISFSLIQALSHPNLFTASVRWSDHMPCYTITLQTPSHAEVVLNTVP